MAKVRSNKIVGIFYSYYPYKGGVARYMTDVVSYLNKFYPVSVICSLCGKGRNVVKINFINKIVGKLFYWFYSAIYLLVNRRNIKYVIIDSVPTNGIIGILSVFLGLKTVVFTHGYEILRKDLTRIEKIKKTLLKYAVVVSNSNYTLSLLKPYHPRKVFLFHPPYRGNFYKRKFIAKDRIVFLSVGAMVPRKGFSLVLEAIAEMDLKYRERIKYIIAGRETDFTKELIKKVEELKLDSIVEIRKNISDEEKIELYKNSDVFIMPSYKINYDVEGFGIVYLEASAHSLPIIATFSGGVPDAVKDGKTGILIEEKNVEQLKEAMVNLIDNVSLRERLGNNGYEFARLFSSEEYMRKLLEIFV